MDNFQDPGVTIPENEQQEPDDPHLQLAREHCAMHGMRLGVARWSSGNSYTQMAISSALMPAGQVEWHARAQKDFMAWLAAGGFSQADSGCAGAPESTHAPCPVARVPWHKLSFVL
ncbi:MAG: hypothetical protein V4582_08195 [Pseudomonadota bacterium]